MVIEHKFRVLVLYLFVTDFGKSIHFSSQIFIIPNFFTVIRTTLLNILTGPHVFGGNIYTSVDFSVFHYSMLKHQSI